MPSMAPLIGALPKLRQMAESLMTDQCVVTRPGDTTTDSDTGLPNTGKEKVYEGSCKVQTSGGLASEQTEGSAAQAMGAVSLVWSLYVHFPYGTPGLRAGDVVEVTEPLIRCSPAGGSGSSHLKARRRTPPPAVGM